MDEQEERTSPKFGIGAMVTHPMFGVGRVTAYEGGAYVMLFKGGDAKRVSFSYEDLEAVSDAGDPELDRIKQAVRQVLGDYGWLDVQLEMGSRWQGGKLRMEPGDAATQSKEVPLDMFFKKLIGVREKLRVLEQKVNNHPSLSPEDKLELEGYITRCYGSLTTFNTLFASKDGHFRGSGKADSNGE